MLFCIYGKGVRSAGGKLGGATKKILLCAPSNAAVDELVRRLTPGVGFSFFKK